MFLQSHLFLVPGPPRAKIVLISYLVIWTRYDIMLSFWYKQAPVRVLIAHIPCTILYLSQFQGFGHQRKINWSNLYMIISKRRCNALEKSTNWASWICNVIMPFSLDPETVISLIIYFSTSSSVNIVLEPWWLSAFFNSSFNSTCCFLFFNVFCEMNLNFWRRNEFRVTHIICIYIIHYPYFNHNSPDELRENDFNDIR